jgi:diguanylate cyclase (GGDEF)-like protein
MEFSSPGAVHSFLARHEHHSRRVEDKIALHLNEYYQEVSQRMQTAQTPEEALDVALVDLKKMGFFAPRIYRRNNGSCHLVRALDIPSHFVEGQFGFDKNHPVYQELFIQGKPFYVAENTLDPHLIQGTDDPSLHLPSEARGLIAQKYLISSPILQKEVGGVLVVNYNPKHLTANAHPDSLGWGILNYVGNMVSVQLARILELRQYQLQRELDGLSGLFDYSPFKRDQQICHRLIQQGAIFYLFRIDCDDFRRINNETKDHMEGDKVIADLGRYLKSQADPKSFTIEPYFTKPGDVRSYRPGGDEFALILRADPNQDEAELDQAALSLAERIRNDAHELYMPQGFSPLSVSVGVAAAKKRMYTCAYDWHRVADGNAYEAKQCGKDRVSLSGLTNRICPSCS